MRNKLEPFRTELMILFLINNIYLMKLFFTDKRIYLTLVKQLKLMNILGNLLTCISHIVGNYPLLMIVLVILKQCRLV